MRLKVIFFSFLIIAITYGRGGFGFQFGTTVNRFYSIHSTYMLSYAAGVFFKQSIYKHLTLSGDFLTMNVGGKVDNLKVGTINGKALVANEDFDIDSRMDFFRIALGYEGKIRNNIFLLNLGYFYGLSVDDRTTSNDNFDYSSGSMYEADVTGGYPELASPDMGGIFLGLSMEKKRFIFQFNYFLSLSSLENFDGVTEQRTKFKVHGLLFLIGFMI